MARPLRIEYRGAFYHVINRGQSRRDIFLEDKGRQTFLDLLAEIARLWKIEVHAYCLMSNYYHLLVSTPAAGECGSPTCSKFTSSFGIDAKLFIGIASVYPDRCKQSLQHSAVVARLVWVLDRG